MSRLFARRWPARLIAVLIVSLSSVAGTGIAWSQEVLNSEQPAPAKKPEAPKKSDAQKPAKKKPAAPQSQKAVQANVTRIGDWQQVCVKNKCFIRATVATKEKKRLVVWSITREKDSKLYAVMTVPLGILIDSKISILFDDSEKSLNVNKCDRAGCHAVFELDDDIANRLRKSESVKVRFVFADGKAAAVPVSLSGISKALESI